MALLETTQRPEKYARNVMCGAGKKKKGELQMKGNGTTTGRNEQETL